MIDPDVLVALRALAEPLRLRVAGRLTRASASVDVIAAELGLAPAAVRRAIATLERAGLARGGDDGWALDARRLGEIGRALAAIDRGEQAASPPLVSPGGRTLSVEDSKVIRSFVVDGRLVSIPAGEWKRLVVLRWLLEAVFTDERDYLEAEVNQRLALFHRDVASLRRYLVDAGLATRDHGRYRRATARDDVAATPTT
ncbi:MAG TPA: DUF2087 domain-containing protein [Candidatus Limnocylindrales bacterium]|nr:DUF2087 domain-containing protein [Candidatus Limnocylindrales bacterium]